ncbi:MAG: hypothetical protein SGILL_009870, partial [Bacillariaceae sp.]
MRAAMVQAATDMDVNFVMDLYEEFDSDTMADDIRAAASSASPPDALIVTIPTPEVQEAVLEVIQSLPIFGFNSAPNDPTLFRSLKGFVHMDEFVAGLNVGEYIGTQLSGEEPEDPVKALYVNHAPDNDALTIRYDGISSSTEWMTWEMTEDVSEEGLTALLSDCSYSAIQMAGFSSMNATLSALENIECPEVFVVGVFDTNADVYDEIQLGTVNVAVSQQQHLQASMVVVMAALGATTGQNLVAPSEEGAYLSGPYLVTAENLPSKEQQICAGDGFPVCPNTMTPLGEDATCACTDRKEIKIVAVTHATTTDIFWDPVFAGFEQAASDFGVTFETTRFDPEASDSDVISEQIVTIEAACQEDIDGLIVSFPSADVADAVEACTERGIPVIDINAGPEIAGVTGYQYLGQNDTRGGVEAGERVIAAGAVQGWCMSHANVTVLADRCDGFAQAFAQSDGVEFMGVISVPADDAVEYLAAVEAALGPGSGLALIAPMVGVVQKHPELLAGAFDVDSTLYQALDDGDLLFGIDQQGYLQGYWPVVLSTWYAYTNEGVVNQQILTGPTFVTESPSDDEQ